MFVAALYPAVSGGQPARAAKQACMIRNKLAPHLDSGADTGFPKKIMLKQKGQGAMIFRGKIVAREVSAVPRSARR